MSPSATHPSTSLRYACPEPVEGLRTNGCLSGHPERKAPTPGVEGRSGQAWRDPKRAPHAYCTKIRQFALWSMVCDWMGIINTVIHMKLRKFVDRINGFAILLFHEIKLKYEFKKNKKRLM